ncbi:MAG: DUF4345 domain-containing protein [Pseudomonadota bacterium]
MLFAIHLLRVTALSFIAFGMCFIAAPGYFSEALAGEMQTTPSALIDMRATYGGMGLGTGLVLWSLARQRETVVAGLIASLLVLGSIATARLAGCIVDGMPNAYMLIALVLEVSFFAMTLLALKRITD